jgi:hypothetical protein
METITMTVIQHKSQLIYTVGLFSHTATKMKQFLIAQWEAAQQGSPLSWKEEGLSELKYHLNTLYRQNMQNRFL